VGSDAPGWPVMIDNLPAWSTTRELELLHLAGLTPTEVLAAATSVPAEMLGLTQDLGALRVGLAEDLVVMTGGPLTDIGAWRTVTQVIPGGEMRTHEGWLGE
jgi:imidazolonepropionase-like amidohydrolase